MKKIIFSLLAIVSPVFAETVLVSVNGMVCGFCVQAITKKVQALNEVEKVNVDLDNKKVTIEIKEGQPLEDSKIKEAITSAGYTVVSIERS